MKQVYLIGSVRVSMLLGGTDEPHKIVWVGTPKGAREEGNAKRALQVVCEDADKEKAILITELVQGERGTDIDLLAKLFKSVGFERDPRDPKKNPNKTLMTRQVGGPKAVED